MEEVTIIGAGPAGIATALQLRRYGMTPILLERDAIGGLLKNANRVENYPGFPKGISGLRLVSLFQKQLEERRIEVLFEEVKRIDWEGGRFQVETQRKTFFPRLVVVASGTKSKKFTDFEIPPETRDGIFYEISPLFKKRGKMIAIVGAGDAAFDYALSLAKNNQVVILNREETVKCLPLLWERAMKSLHITYCQNTKISKIRKNSGEELALECSTPNGISRLSAHYLVFAIGREPQLDFLSEGLKEKVLELINQETLFMVGDVKNGSFRQTAIAAGEGVMAAMKIHRKLEGRCP
ncbi:MAG: hypothetical protein A2142_00665 [candidate division Zixibacteria bacterium RBG_16_48_11]|nr:MAG: hypothetical protein A2142_00665 [candidate division Zixibacteria bacterium RBG_16_48_11]